MATTATHGGNKARAGVARAAPALGVPLGAQSVERRQKPPLRAFRSPAAWCTERSSDLSFCAVGPTSAGCRRTHSALATSCQCNISSTEHSSQAKAKGPRRCTGRLLPMATETRLPGSCGIGAGCAGRPAQRLNAAPVRQFAAVDRQTRWATHPGHARASSPSARSVLDARKQTVWPNANRLPVTVRPPNRHKIAKDFAEIFRGEPFRRKIKCKLQNIYIF